MTEPTKQGGRSVVLFLYVAIVVFTGFVGFLLASLGVATEPVAFLGLIEFPATPIGLALYGSLTLATVLGVPLVLVVYVSRRAGVERAE